MKKNYGFTLIELLIVIVIIGILAAIVYPSYQNSVMETRRSEAKSQLLQLANFMERRFTADSAYNTENAATTLTSSGIENTNHYTYSIPTLTANSYTLQATPIGNQASDSCKNLTIAHTGATAATGTGICWE